MYVACIAWSMGKRVDGLSGDRQSWESRARKKEQDLPRHHAYPSSQTLTSGISNNGRAPARTLCCSVQPLLHRGGVKHSSPLLLNPKNRMLVEITKSTMLLIFQLIFCQNYDIRYHSLPVSEIIESNSLELILVFPSKKQKLFNIIVTL